MASMPTTVEELGEDKVKLTVDVPAHDVQHAVEHAADDLAASVRVPGFRRGKVPRPILLQRIGKERLFSEAVSSHIGGWFWNAATRARVNPVAQPEYDYDLPASENEDWRFSATVEVQPKPEPADWTELEVPKREAEVPEEAVQAELEALQRSVAELVPVEDRPAVEGDTVVVDLLAEDGSAQRDYVVELGSERLVEEIENAVRGLLPGEQREVRYQLADGSPRLATVVLKEIREPVLPPLDDDLAKSASEFDTLAELRAEIEERLRGQVEQELESLFRAAVVGELIKASNVQPGGPLVELRTRELLTAFARSLQTRGMTIDVYAQLTGQTPEQLAERFYLDAALSVAQEQILDAVADNLGIEVTDDDIREELRAGGDSDEDIDRFFDEGGADRIRDDVRMRRALDHVAAEVKPIAPELHEARESIWTPGQEQPAEPAKLWTPGR
jgi:trigger factor